MIRKIVGVILGYIIFAVSAVALFKLSGQAPHADPTIIFAILTTVYGAVFSFIAGLIAQLIAKTTDLKINYVLAFIMAGFATFSLIKTNGNHWTQLLAIFVFAPASVLGAQFYLKHKQKAALKK
jgi:hypothetical protein